MTPGDEIWATDTWSWTNTSSQLLARLNYPGLAPAQVITNIRILIQFITAWTKVGNTNTNYTHAQLLAALRTCTAFELLMSTCPQRRDELKELLCEPETWWMFVVSGCEGGHLNGQPNALNDHHHHQYQSRANLRQEVRHNDRDGVSLGRVRDVMLVQWSISRELGELLSCAMQC